jgi:hypothetical protein
VPRRRPPCRGGLCQLYFLNSYDSVNTQLAVAAVNGDRATEVAAESRSAGDVGEEHE